MGKEKGWKEEGGEEGGRRSRKGGGRRKVVPKNDSTICSTRSVRWSRHCLHQIRKVPSCQYTFFLTIVEPLFLSFKKSLVYRFLRRRSRQWRNIGGTPLRATRNKQKDGGVINWQISRTIYKFLTNCLYGNTHFKSRHGTPSCRSDNFINDRTIIVTIIDVDQPPDVI